jgi:phosphatidylglycerol lysyltransferase
MGFTHDEMRSRARDLVMAYGWNTTSYQILNPGIDHWFAPQMAAVAGYIRARETLMVVGAPIGPSEVLTRAVEMLERHGRDQGYQICYVCVEGQLKSLLACSRNHSAVALGAQPIWNPQRWARIAETHAPLRRQLNRARNKGVTVESISPQAARNDDGIRRLLIEWLAARPLPALRFLTEPLVLLGELRDRILLVARLEHKPVAFLVASPVPARGGYLVEQIVRSRQAANGTVELLVDSAMRRFASWGRTFATLGLVALASKAHREIASNPWWLRTSMRMARNYANCFYNFRGLEHFRAKMFPETWEPVYAISNERRFSLGSIYAIAHAFCGVAPWRLVPSAVARLAQRQITKYRSSR